MGKKEENLTVGALVFARVKGYAPWPAKITKAEPKKKKYFVYFYGTGEASHAMKAEDLYTYTDHKEQFVNDKNLKRKFYKEAVEQIEAALRGEEDVASINNVSDVGNVLDESQAQDSSVNVTQDDSAAVDVDSSVNLSTNATIEPEKPAKKSSAKQAKNNTQNDRKSPKVKLDVIDTPIEPPPAEPIVSRSGRKIKPKRYLEMEMEESISPVPRKRPTLTEDHLKNETPESPPKPAEPTSPPPVKSPVVKSPVKNSAVGSAKKKSNKDFILNLESNLIELDHLIKASVGLSSANPEKCIEHLDEYKTLEITPLMLKKHPGCVETMKRLRRYVGNAKKWDMDESGKADFEKKANQIRVKAEEIYSTFKRMFPANETEGRSFWESFMDEVQKFRNKTQNLEQNEVIELIEEPEGDTEVEIAQDTISDDTEKNQTESNGSITEAVEAN